MSENMQIFELAKKLKERKEAKSELEKKEKELTAEITAIDRELSELMMETECPSFACAGKLFYLCNHVHASALDGNKEKLYQTLKKNGYGDLVTETVNSKTLDSFVKDQMEENNGILPEWLEGAVSVYEQVKVNMRKN